MKELMENWWSIWSRHMIFTSTKQYVIAHCIAMNRWLIVVGTEIGERWLVHIIPDAVDTLLEQATIGITPPVSNLRTRKIRKDTCTEPNTAKKDLTIDVATKV